MITGCSTSRQQADDLRYSFKNTFTVEAKESEYIRLRKALISPNYWAESDITVAQRMFELTKDKAKASPYGIGERLDRAVEEALIIGISAGFIHAGGRVINEINSGALLPTPAAVTGSASVAKTGDSFGKLGQLVENPGIKVDWANTTTHGMARMVERGVTQSMVNSWVQNGSVLQQSSGNYLYVTKDGAAALTSAGRLVTTYPSTHFDANMQDIIEKLFGK